MLSAKQAGFFLHGEDRLVRPALQPGPGTKPTETTNQNGDTNERVIDKKNGGGKGGGEPPDLHPFIQGLLKTLPNPETETGEKKDWPLAQRVKWLQTAANIFDLIYEGEGGIEVKAAMATRSPRPHDQ
jgi:hypothetical protein